MWLEVNDKMYNMDIYKRMYVDGYKLVFVDSTEEEGSPHRLKKKNCGTNEDAWEQYEIYKRHLQRR